MMTRVLPGAHVTITITFARQVALGGVGEKTPSQGLDVNENQHGEDLELYTSPDNNCDK
jgi:hypothetical protein